MKKDELEKPFKWPWAVSKMVCSQCGQVSEIDFETAQKLISTMAILGNRPEIPLETKIDFKGYYFEANYCKNCQPKEEVEVKIKEIVESC